MLATFINLDLLTVGITIAGIGVLGFAVFFSNHSSITNKSFLLFAVLTILYGVVNYLDYKLPNPIWVLWALRLVIFLAVLHAYSLLQLIYVFPNEKVEFSKFYRLFIFPLTVVAAIVALTPYTFISLNDYSSSGGVPIVNKGPGLLLFVTTVLILVITAVSILIKKFIRSRGLERTQLKFVLIGILITFSLIIVFNFVMPLAFNIVRFVPLAPVFFFPLIAFISYPIYRHRLFNLRMVATATISFLVTIFSFANIIFSSSQASIIVNSTAFLIILIGSIELIRSMIREREQSEALKKANEGQANLIHIINHQIKGYLAKSRNIFAELLSDESYGPISNEMRPMLEEGAKSLGEGVDFVQQVLNSSSAEKGTLAYVMEPIDFKEVTNEMFEHEKPEATEKNLALELKVDDGDYKTKGDFVQLKEAVRNLISNSVIYTPSGSVKVHLTRKDNKILLTVTDTGVGLSDEDKQRLFTKGGRGKDSLKVNINSTGYGLSFVKAVVEAHKGRVWAESEGRGKGSTFSLELPVA